MFQEINIQKNFSLPLKSLEICLVFFRFSPESFQLPQVSLFTNEIPTIRRFPLCYAFLHLFWWLSCRFETKSAFRQIGCSSEFVESAWSDETKASSYVSYNAKLIIFFYNHTLEKSAMNRVWIQNRRLETSILCFLPLLNRNFPNLRNRSYAEFPSLQLSNCEYKFLFGGYSSS